MAVFRKNMVWFHSGNFKQKKEICLIGIREGLNSNMSITVAKEVSKIFRGENIVFIPIDIVELCLAAFAENDKEQNMIYGFEEWLNVLSQDDPDMALDGVETYIKYAKQAMSHKNGILNQILQIILRNEFEKSVNKHNRDLAVKGSAYWKQFVSMLFA